MRPNKTLLPTRTRRGIGVLIRTVMALGIALVAMLPLLWALGSSLRPADEIFKTLNEFSLHTFIPTTWTLENYRSLLAGSFPMALGNSVIVVVATISLGLTVSVFAAFALAVLRFRLRDALFAVLVVSFLVPFEAISIPLSATLRTLGLQDTYVALVLPGLGGGLAIFLLRQFFVGVPAELSEAARLDGLGWFGVLTRIYIPISKPAVIGAGLIIFTSQWQAYIWPLLIAPSPNMRVAPVAVANYMGELGTNFGEMFAAAVATTLLPLILFLTLQRQFTTSLAGAYEK